MILFSAPFFLCPVARSYRVLKKAQCGLLVAMGDDHEIYSLAVLVNGDVKVLPLTIDLDVSLVHSSTLAHRAFLAFPKG